MKEFLMVRKRPVVVFHYQDSLYEFLRPAATGVLRQREIKNSTVSCQAGFGNGKNSQFLFYDYLIRGARS